MCGQREVLLKVGGLEYKEPGKRQRVVISSIVIGLNALLVLAVIAYFYMPSFLFRSSNQAWNRDVYIANVKSLHDRICNCLKPYKDPARYFRPLGLSSKSRYFP